MTDGVHKFKVGQTVRLVPSLRSGAKGAYQIVSLRPTEAILLFRRLEINPLDRYMEIRRYLAKRTGPLRVTMGAHVSDIFPNR